MLEILCEAWLLSLPAPNGFLCPASKTGFLSFKGPSSYERHLLMPYYIGRGNGEALNCNEWLSLT